MCSTGDDHDHRPAVAGRRAPSRRGMMVGAGAACLAGLAPAAVWAESPAVAREMALAARRWLDGLTAPARKEAQLAFASRQREDWHYVPRGRPGVRLAAMTAGQRAAAFALLGALLGARGLEEVEGTIRLEGILGELTGARGFRDPGNYALVLFGDPAGAAPWSWRFEGHHLSLTAVVVPEVAVAVTPLFVGANPARVPAGHSHAGFRLLGEREDRAFALVRSLEGAARAKAVIADRSLGDIVSGPGREAELKTLAGASLALLNEAQRVGVLGLAEAFTGALRPELAGAAMTRIREAGLDRLHFAWAGSLERGRPHYFRVHGPTMLIEYDNTQDGANHVHSVWIDPTQVLGRDLLKAHHKTQH